VAAKAADNVARLAAVLHVFEHGPAGTIGRDMVEGAARIVLWHTYSARSLLGPLSISRDLGNAANLSRWLIDRCTIEGVAEFSTTTILQSGPNGTRSREALDQALRILTDHGHARLREQGKRKLVMVNPHLLGADLDEPDAPPRAMGGEYAA
jgi:putative DNA primase/helicase